MDPRHLALLRELADRGTVAAVAAATHRTPSAVSQQLRTAQRELGVPLVEPSGRGLRLTDAGLLLARSAVEVESALARAQAALDELRGGVSGTVRLAALPSAAEYLLPPLLAALREEPVDVVLDDVDLAEHEYAEVAHDVDVVIGHSLSGPVPRGSGRLACTVLAEEPIDVALPHRHPLARRTTLRAADVVDQPWVGVPLGYPFDTVLQRIEAATGRPAEVRQRVRDNRVVAALVAAGEGLALLPRFTTARDVVTLRPLEDVPSSRWVVAMARPERAERAVVRRVLDVLVRAGQQVATG